MNSKRTFLTVVGSAALLIGYLSIGLERYCFIYPGIDTRYAAGFSEARFAEVRVGMTKAEVVSLLGEPLESVPAQASARWSYTQDGKCFWADWAWLGRHIVFRDDRVTEKIARIWYD